MQFIKPDINIDFIGKRIIAYGISGALILISIISLIIDGGPKYGIDFAGGTVVQVKFDAAVKTDAIRKGLADVGIRQPTIQIFGEPEDNEFLIRSDVSEEAAEGFQEKLGDTLKTATGAEVEIRRLEMVGPQVGRDLREKALFAMFYALLFITIYISGRFELKWVQSGAMAAVLIGAVYLLSLLKMSIPFLIFSALIVSLVLFWFLKFKYAMGAIVALIHDVTITVGVFALFNKEFSLPIIAALLTIIGYSLNDTIIVFDRIRENLKKFTKNPMEVIINRSINETLSRTILTSGTTLVVVAALFFLGGGIIHDFAFALLVGIGIGTYSSIYVASPILIAWQKAAGKR
ncbi:protein translocase subunit SecF [Desulfococcus sp.]|uniref:protein translocase subunit SecF n=1 Tax=Desulfococcus sp. TaxID=2025834 RepID=UPI00359303A4